MAMDRIDKPSLVGRNVLEQFQRAGAQAAGSGRAGDAPGGGTAEPAERAEISSRARRLVELRQTLATARSAYEALDADGGRTTRLEQVRARLATGAYHTEEVRQAVAGRLVGVLRRLSEL
jgi:hypothetical protein